MSDETYYMYDDYRYQYVDGLEGPLGLWEVWQYRPVKWDKRSSFRCGLKSDDSGCLNGNDNFICDKRAVEFRVNNNNNI